jgi:hypothetical protein
VTVLASGASAADSDDSSQASFLTATSQQPPGGLGSPGGGGGGGGNAGQHMRSLSGDSLGGFSELDTPPRDVSQRCVFY